MNETDIVIFNEPNQYEEALAKHSCFLNHRIRKFYKKKKTNTRKIANNSDNGYFTIFFGIKNGIVSVCLDVGTTKRYCSYSALHRFYLQFLV